MVAGSAPKFTSIKGFRALKVELALALWLTGPVTLDRLFFSQPQFRRVFSGQKEVFISSSDKYHNATGLVLRMCLMNEDTQWVASALAVVF